MPSRKDIDPPDEAAPEVDIQIEDVTYVQERSDVESSRTAIEPTDRKTG